MIGAAATVSPSLVVWIRSGACVSLRRAAAMTAFAAADWRARSSAEPPGGVSAASAAPLRPTTQSAALSPGLIEAPVWRFSVRPSGMKIGCL
jgi:hypothetical protein